MSRKDDIKVIKDSSSVDGLDTMLYHIYESDNIPDHVNIALKNRIAYEAAYGKKKIELWWLPAVLNTIIASIGIIFAIILYQVAVIGGSYTIIPNIIGKVSELSLKVILLWAIADMFLGWLATVIVIPIASGKKFFGGVKML